MDGSERAAVGRPKSRTTDCTGGVCLAGPENAAFRAVREALEARMPAKTLPCGDERALYGAQTPIVVMGNLSDNPCVRYLYYKYLCVTDLHYPGPGGYEIRTLLDPFGTGYNLIHIGYSDEAGALAAARVFSGLATGPVLPYFCEVRAAQTHYPPEKERQIEADRYDLSSPAAFYTSTSLEDKGYLAYLRGERGALMGEFEEAMRAFLKRPFTHLKLQRRVLIWRLLEATGMMDDALAEQYAEFFYRGAQTGEGVGSILTPHYQSPYFPRQNHGLYPAFGLFLLADYFNRYHPELSPPYEWKEAAERVFSVYAHGSFKPLCDGLCHGWWMSQPVMLDYALFTDGHAYLESGGARKAAEYAMAVIDNEGFMPAAGDGLTGPRQFPHMSLSVAAAYYGDGRYRYMLEKAPLWRRGYAGLAADLPRTFDVGVRPEKPEDLIGVTAVEMDPLVYHAWEREPQLAPLAADTPPHAPIGECFDKLSVRTGLGERDDYLLLDGLGGASHSYADAMGILDYETRGVSLLAQEDNLIANEPGGQNVLTLFRDGGAEPVPAFARLLERRVGEDGCVYVRMELSDYAGARWQRAVCLIPRTALLIQDTVTAERRGEYLLESHFRVPGRARLDGDTLRAVRRDADGRPVEFLLRTECSRPARHFVDTQSFTAFNYRLYPGEPEAVEDATNPVHYLRERYHLHDDELFLHVYAAHAAATLEAGERVVFTTLTLPSSPGDGPARVGREGARMTLTAGGRTYRTPLSAGEPVPAAAPPVLRRAERTAYALDGAVTALLPAADGGLFAATKTGVIHRLQDGVWGKWAELGAPVRCLCQAHGVLAAGVGDDRIALIGENGAVLCGIRIGRVPTLYPWWEMDTPACVALAAGTFRGEPAFAAGCGDDHVHFYAPDGRPLGVHYMDTTGVPDTILTADVNGDGQDEYIVTCCRSSCSSQVDIVDAEGRRLSSYGNEGWVSVSSALAVFSAGGRTAVAHGMRQRRNLELHAFAPTPAGQPVRPVCLLKARAAGPVVGFVPLPDEEALISLTAQGALLCHGFDGNLRWRASVPGVPVGIAGAGGRIVCADRDGALHIRDQDGNTLGDAATGLASPRLLFCGDTLYAAGGEKLLALGL